ncbi:hypothetical protein OG762_00930 [Streptomyces sp. NBC_01136]|uniref:FUSC family protein n=1 Tax=unclassified Streptomyces TaxID=2593676 RepID=UPI0032458020|nr:hypothetical protein OG762_00930 [Streptomyces sp. NBC_01136]
MGGWFTCASDSRWSGSATARSVKNVIAAVTTWAVAGLWAAGPPQYLAVATALLMVNAETVYRSVTDALHRVVTRVLGVSLALGAAWLMGSTLGSIVAILGVALVMGGRRMSDDRLQVASTAIVSLTAAAVAPMGSVISLVGATLTGVVVGTAVNALVLPPVHLETSEAAIRGLAQDMGTLLRDMGRGLRERQQAGRAYVWLEKGRDLERRFADAREYLEQAEESLRWNTRCSVHKQRRPVTYGEAFQSLHRVSFQVRGIARTLADNAHDARTDHRLGQQFLDRYAETLEWSGRAVEEFVGLEEIDARERLQEAIDRAMAWHGTMTDLVGRGTLAKPEAWHHYGSLMTDVERLLTDLDRADGIELAARPVA